MRERGHKMKTIASKVMVIMLSMMMTVSSFATFSFAEEPQDQQAKAESSETVAEKKSEAPKAKAPAPEPVKEKAPEPKPEPKPEKEDNNEPASDNGSVNDSSSGEAVNDNSPSQGDQAANNEGSEDATEEVSVQNVEQTGQAEEPKKDEMPAQSFSGSTSDLSVNASAPKGAFPEGTKMKVSAANAASIIKMSNAATGEDFTVVDAVAADISFYKDGKEIQPAGGKAVSVKLKANHAVDGEEHSVIHVAGGSVDIVGNASAGGASVKAGSFSIYGIIGGNYESGAEEYARYTYVFMAGAEEIGTKIVRDGDTLEAPAMNLDDPNKQFEAWYDGDTKMTLPMTVSIPEDVKEDKTITLNAKFKGQSNVTFMSPSDHVLDVRTGVVDETVSTEGIDVQVSASEAVVGWAKTKNAEAALNEIKFEENDYILYPVIEEVKWVRFDSNAGDEAVTHIDSVYVKSGGSVNAPAITPVRTGYTFDGWYTKALGGDKVSFPLKVTRDITLYAHWKAGRTSYTVRVWKEALVNGNYVSGNYVFAMTEEIKNVNSGSVVSISNGNNYNFSDKKYYDFEKADQNVTVKGDGTTILNVYFKFKVYTVKFNLNSGSVYGGLTKGGSSYGPGSNTTYSFTARFGENIFDKWPQQSEMKAYTKKNNSRYEESKDTKFVRWGKIWASNRFTFTNDIIERADSTSGTTLTYNPEFLKNPSKYEVNYWLQKPDKSGYEKDTVLSQKEFYYSGTFGHKELAGFTYLSSTPKGYPGSDDKKRIYNFYYDRNALTLTFVNGGRTDKTESVVYEQNLANYNYTPTKPASVVGNAKFDGWYTDELFTKKFDFTNSLMTPNNLTLYAKWIGEQCKVSFNMNGADSNPIATEQVEYGKTATKPADPTRQDFNFGGWLKDGKAYNFAEQVTADIELTAKWLKAETEFQVVYMMNDEVVAAPSAKYSDGANAVALGRPSAVPEGKEFKGWSYTASQTTVDVAAGKSFVIDYNRANAENKIVLHAVLTEQNLKVKITYMPGEGIGSAKVVEGLVINGNYKLATAQECGFKAPNDKEFAGWKNAEGKVFAENDTVAVGKDEKSNILTAQWKDIPKTKVRVTIIGTSADDKEYNGKVQSIEGFDYKVKPASSDGPIIPILRMFRASTKDSEDALKDAVSVELKEGSEAKASGINANTYYMGLEPEDFKITAAPGYEVVGDPEIEDGKMVISPYGITVQISGNKGSVEENGQEQSVFGFKANALGDEHPESFDTNNIRWMEGETPVAKGTEVGKYMMGLYKEGFSYTDNNFAVSFELINDGELTITAKAPEDDTEVLGEYDDGSGDNGNGGKGKSTGGMSTGDKDNLFLNIEILSLAVVSLIMMLNSRRRFRNESE